jgi:hypothetical protein
VERGFDRVKRKTKETASEIGGIGVSLKGVGAASAWAAGAIGTADLVTKAFDAQHIDEFANALKSMPIVGGLVSSVEGILGTWTGISAEIKNATHQTNILNAASQAHYNIAKQIREANIAGAMQVANLQGRFAVLNPGDPRSRATASTEEGIAERRREMEERFRKERDALREQIMHGEGAKARSEARKQIQELDKITAGAGSGWRAGDTLPQKIANWWDPSRVRNAENQKAIAQGILEKTAADEQKARDEMNRRHKAEREALAKLEAEEIRERKYLEAETLRPVRDSILLSNERLRYGERAARMKAVELEYEKQIVAAEHERNKPLANMLRIRRDQALADEKRSQDFERYRERGDINTEIGTRVLNLLGRRDDAQRLQLNRDIANRMLDARQRLTGPELDKRMRELETLRKVGMAEITMQGGVGVSSGSEFIGARKRVSGLSYGQVSAAVGEVANAVRVEGWDRQLELLERIADAIGAAGVPGRAS